MTDGRPINLPRSGGEVNAPVLATFAAVVSRPARACPDDHEGRGRIDRSLCIPVMT